jgi:hypothetical protein
VVSMLTFSGFPGSSHCRLKEVGGCATVNRV